MKFSRWSNIFFVGGRNFNTQFIANDAKYSLFVVKIDNVIGKHLKILTWEVTILQGKFTFQNKSNVKNWSKLKVRKEKVVVKEHMNPTVIEKGYFCIKYTMLLE